MSDSESGSSEYSGSSSESDSPELLGNPVFVKKSGKQGKLGKTKDLDQKDHSDEKHNPNERILQNIENLEQSSHPNQDQFTVDDTDGLDPEQEYFDWQQREYARYIRDREEAIQLEQEQADLLRRKQLADEKFPPSVARESSSNSTKAYGAFYNDDPELQHKLQNRDGYKKVDHSRPTRFNND